MSNRYAAALDAYLTEEKVRQEDLAARIRRSQVAVSRYANGARFPDADTARAIEQATDGVIAFSLWQATAIERFGIGEAA